MVDFLPENLDGNKKRLFAKLSKSRIFTSQGENSILDESLRDKDDD